jgi:hypothetical protein
MGLRFQKRIRLAPGLRLNLGLKSASLSAGFAADLPGTGFSYQKRLSRRRRAHGTFSGLIALGAIAYLLLAVLGII